MCTFKEHFGLHSIQIKQISLYIFQFCYRLWQVPYFWSGIKAYDVLAGKQLLKPSYYLSKRKALELFPMLKREKLVGALVYYDGKTIFFLLYIGKPCNGKLL